VSRVAVVVDRFGAGMTGGAEKLAREVSLRLAGNGHALTVLTTCAEDYVSWANVLPPGESQDGPLRVLRFPTARPRDLQRWEEAMQPILSGRWDAEDEDRVLHEAGPDAPGLLEHLRDHGGEYAAVILFTLLYLPTVAGLPLVWDRAILVPTLHDEIAAHLLSHARAIRLARTVMWNTPEERALAERLYDVDGLRGVVAGVGVEPPADVQPDRGRAHFGLERPYLLYAGRIDPDKGCGEMIGHFLAWAERDPRADLVLCGRAWMRIPEHPRIHHLGVVSSQQLWHVQSAALATVVPSRLESLSMLALESLACGVPILVPTGSPVLQGHVRRSSAGLVYGDAVQFATAAALLLDRPRTAAALGRNGRAYVAANFTWERIVGLYEQAVAQVARTAELRRRRSAERRAC
jgi:glycosyltransferase involved in cell wall biosynthesis